MTKFFSEFLRDESGASAAEYALILAVVGAGIGGAALFLGNAINTSVRGAGSKIASCGAAATAGC
jgi:pilus assembly protein Flp/PilA